MLDCPTDKSLGCALISREKYDSLASAALSASFEEVSSAAVDLYVRRFQGDISEVWSGSPCRRRQAGYVSHLLVQWAQIACNQAAHQSA